MNLLPSMFSSFYCIYSSNTQHNTTQGVLAALLGVIGVIVMTFMDSTDLNTQFLIYAIFFGVFGMGVGGEYPLTAMSASQHHSETMEEAAMEDDERRKSRCLVRSVMLCYIIIIRLLYCIACFMFVQLKSFRPSRIGNPLYSSSISLWHVLYCTIQMHSVIRNVPRDVVKLLGSFFQCRV